MLIELMFAAAAALPPQAPPGDPQAGGGSTDLSRQATDPTASLMSLGFITTYTGEFHGRLPGADDDRWEIKFQPVIPFDAFEMPNILRISLPFQLDGRGEEGLGTVSVFNLTVISETWGRWGVGPVMSLSGEGDAPDTFAFGPAVGGVAQLSKSVNAGLFNQNVFWDDTAVSQFQPILAVQLGDAWSLSAGDLQFTYDWKDDRWVNLPVGFQLGKVLHLGGQAWRAAINPQYNLADDDGLEEWKVVFSVTLLLPRK